MKRDKTAKKEENLFRSTLFRRLFLSYVVLILLFLAGASTWYLTSYSENERNNRLKSARQTAESFATEADRTLLTARALCSAMDASESIRNLYQTILIEKSTPDSMQLYKVRSEITRIKASADSLEVYSIMLGFTGDKRLYASGSVIALDQAITATPQSTLIEVTSVSELLGQTIPANITVNKQFLVYAEPYVSASYGPGKGLMMVLMDPDRLAPRVNSLMQVMSGLEIRNGAMTVYTAGAMPENPESLEIRSLVDSNVIYRMQISEKTINVPIPFKALVPVILLALAGVLTGWVMFRYLQARYHPIGEITQMVKREEENQGETDELVTVMRGITNLIGERNGYREKMITISPYASHGALHQLLSGNLEGNQIRVLREEQFLGLRNGYYMVGIVNLALRGTAEQRYLDVRTLAGQALADMSDEEMTVVTCPRDAQNLYAVVNGDDPEKMTELFYRMLPAIEEALDDETAAVTLGVSRPGTELEQLREACLEAAAALENMILGGRGSVYFYEEKGREESREYYFPADTRQRMVRALREGQEQELNTLMDALWEKNFRKASLSPEAVRQLVDELHSCVSGALREISEQSTTHIRVERIREPATIEEIFSYYRSTLTEALKACREMQETDMEGEELEQAICDYVAEHALNPDLSLSAVADHFGVSGKLVGTVCKNRTGKTYLQIVHDCRIQEAVRLLEETDLSLEEIAEKCGFSNVLTFRRNFKAAMNKNPSDYRRE